MTDNDPSDGHSDPTPVMKFVAWFIITMSVIVVVGVAIFEGREFNKWVVIAMAVPVVGSLIMASDKLRDWILSIASSLPFINYKKP